MKKLLIAAMFAASPAFADFVARDGKDSLRLTNVPCPETMAKHIPADLMERFRAAVAIVDGQTHLGCWTLRADGAVFLRYEDGDAGAVPQSLFRNEPGV
jgi:hypothetical protein